MVFLKQRHTGSWLEVSCQIVDWCIPNPNQAWWKGGGWGWYTPVKQLIFFFQCTKCNIGNLHCNNFFSCQIFRVISLVQATTCILCNILFGLGGGKKDQPERNSSFDFINRSFWSLGDCKETAEALIMFQRLLNIYLWQMKHFLTSTWSLLTTWL